MKFYRVHALFVAIFCFSCLSFGQDTMANYHLKKGEVLDILFLTTKPNTKETMKEYRETAFPVASEMGYSFLPGFRITETTQGNYQPQGLILGKWESLPKREKFLTEIDTRVPNFHQMRRKIWSLFHLTYYEMQEDVSLELDFNKVVIATAYWKQENQDAEFDSYISEWKNTLEKTGGTLKIALTNGYSPFGYEYNPTYMAITQWDKEEDFEAFLEENLKMDRGGLKNVNQFILSK